MTELKMNKYYVSYAFKEVDGMVGFGYCIIDVAGQLNTESIQKCIKGIEQIHSSYEQGNTFGVEKDKAMTNTEINRALQEAMGGCWHEIDDNGYVLASSPMSGKCRHCRGLMTKGKPNNPFFTISWADYGKALEWAMKQEWWNEFAMDMAFTQTGAGPFEVLTRLAILNPLKGSIALAEFIKELKKVK